MQYLHKTLQTVERQLLWLKISSSDYDVTSFSSTTRINITSLTQTFFLKFMVDAGPNPRPAD